MYAVILAGGGGTRLWPLSDPRHPKPFLPLFADGSLLQRTVGRLIGGSELGLTLDDIHVVTDRRYAALVSEQTDVGVLSEPVGRNTAAAIALAVVSLERDPDEVMAVLPADHLVEDEAGFRAIVARAADLATGSFGIDSPIATLGAQPTGPATQYGYLVPELARDIPGTTDAHALRAFEEKPDPARAAELIALPGVAWNAGIFLARRRTWQAALEKHTRLVPPLSRAMDSESLLEDAYEKLESISIDYAVMQPAAADGQIVMTAMDVGWSDVGTWTALLDALVGGYSAAAQVVQAGEYAEIGAADLAIVRDPSDVLRVDGGPQKLASGHPLAKLTDARQHRAAIEALVARVNEATITKSEARA
jgi:mannose-1-phosphate guanylyltransferase/mannose-6-phosphate isomerase